MPRIQKSLYREMLVGVVPRGRVYEAHSILLVLR